MLPLVVPANIKLPSGENLEQVVPPMAAARALRRVGRKRRDKSKFNSSILGKGGPQTTYIQRLYYLNSDFEIANASFNLISHPG